MADETLDEKALRLLDLDPATHVVVGTPKFSAWQSGKEGTWLESVKVSVAERDVSVDLDGLVKRLHARRPLRVVPEASGDGDAFVLALADWQTGKGPAANLEATVARLRAGADEAVVRIKDVRKRRPLDTLILAGLGDLVENCSGHYASQAFQTVLDNREQRTLVRELITMFVVKLAPLFPRVILTAIPGNHGESRQGGKNVTQMSDNQDVEAFATVFEAIQMSGQYPQVEWVEPDGQEPWVVLDEGAGICFYHGHLSGTGDQMRWWERQALGKQAPGRAGVLCTGHFHHLRQSEASGRTWLQCPSVETVSEWWRDKTGQVSMPGTLSFVLDDYGVSDLQVLGRRVEVVAA